MVFSTGRLRDARAVLSRTGESVVVKNESCVAARWKELGAVRPRNFQIE